MSLRLLAKVRFVFGVNIIIPSWAQLTKESHKCPNNQEKVVSDSTRIALSKKLRSVVEN